MVARTTPCATPRPVSTRPLHSFTPQIASVRILNPLPREGRRRSEVYGKVKMGILFREEDMLGLLEFMIALVHINIDRFYLAEVFIRFHLLMCPLQLQIQMRKARLGDHQVGSPACCFGDMIFRQSVNKVDIGANHLADATYLLKNVIAVMDNEL